MVAALRRILQQRPRAATLQQLYRSEMSKVKKTSLAQFLKKERVAATGSAAEASKIPESVRLLLLKEWKMQQQPRNTKDVSDQSGRSSSAGQLITLRRVSRKNTVVPIIVPAVWSISSSSYTYRKDEILSLTVTMTFQGTVLYSWTSVYSPSAVLDTCFFENISYG